MFLTPEFYRKSILSDNADPQRKSELARDLNNILNEATKIFGNSEGTDQRARGTIENIADERFFSQLLEKEIRPSIDDPSNRNSNLINLFIRTVQIVPALSLITFQGKALPDRTTSLNSSNGQCLIRNIHRTAASPANTGNHVTKLEGYEVLIEILLKTDKPFPDQTRQNAFIALINLNKTFEHSDNEDLLKASTAANIATNVYQELIKQALSQEPPKGP